MSDEAYMIYEAGHTAANQCKVPITLDTTSSLSPSPSRNSLSSIALVNLNLVNADHMVHNNSVQGKKGSLASLLKSHMANENTQTNSRKANDVSSLDSVVNTTYIAKPDIISPPICNRSNICQFSPHF